MTTTVTETLSSPVERGRQVRKSLPHVGIEQVLVLSQHLSVADRALIKAVYERGASPHALAAAAGQTVHAIQRRLQRLRRRMATPLFRFVVAHRDRWTADRRALADAIVLQGMTQRHAAAVLGLTLHHIRREIDRIKGMCEAAQQ